MARRTRSSLSVGKAKEIVADKGFSRLGDGYDSEKQRKMIYARASGRKLTRLKKS